MTDRSQIQRIKTIADDPLSTQRDRAAAIEILNDFTATGSVTSRKRAAEALGEVLEPGEAVPITAQPVNPLEEFLLACPLDPLCVRFLRHSGRRTFVDVTGKDVAEFMQSEWPRELDDNLHRAKDMRLRAVWDATTLVRARFAMVYQSIDPRIAELLGLDVTCDPESGLADAKRKYAAIAANVDPR
jgi:hypothetical protein